MATRFYCEATGTAPITPSIGGTWTSSGSSIIRPLNTTKAGTTIASTTISVDATSSTASTLFYRGVSLPLAAQTISGTVAGQFRMNVANTTGCTTVSRISIYVVNSAGTVVATLLAGTSGASTLTTTLTNRSTPASVAVSSYACAEGDMVVIEVGIIRTAGTTARNGVISFGSSSATDLAIDNATTTANNPWVEFSANLTFASYAQDPFGSMGFFGF